MATPAVERPAVTGAPVAAPPRPTREAMDGLFIVTAVITAVGIGLAFPLRPGPAPKAPGGAAAVEM